MPVFRLPDEHYFPPPMLAEPSGLLAVGGDLSPQRLVLAYGNGIFPWYSEGQPILWFSPDPRFVLDPEDFYVGRSLKKIVKRGDFKITLDQAFEEVISRCSTVSRPGQNGTWLTSEMIDAYVKLFELGIAHSVEAWKEGILVGGLYGISIGNFYAGESMFALEPNASKVAFVWQVFQMKQWGIELIDCQVYTDHLKRFGAKDISRKEYLDVLPSLFSVPREFKNWSFDEGFKPF
ncbi:MAG: leucyl/phenylalanyl-tRNA--protein transferase [Proteobacteria bacterium]|nr:leucyl/phenylalanyl-tRNA--protein transferase [Pseudomonadota bacterium]